MKAISLKIQQAMVSYLKRRGWIVFWLDEEARHCTGVCWLETFLGVEGVVRRKGK